MYSPFLRKKVRIAERGGIKYQLDLSEGIDFSLFLFGQFQGHVFNSKLLSIPEDAQVIDIGGNVGVMALQFAKKAPKGRIISIEPTHYGISKFKRNLELNPDLAGRIEIVNVFFSNKKSENPNIKAFASWKIDGTRQDKHPVHWGTEMSTNGVASITLDEFCEINEVERIDFIKIDTDGHEYEILGGAVEAIRKYRPQIIFEVGKYVLDEKGINFEFYINFFKELNYVLYDSGSGKKIVRANYHKIVPELGAIDVIALPNKLSK